MLLESKTLTGLQAFLEGYRIACVHHGIGEDRLGWIIPPDFHDWVAYRTHFRESTSGWCRMIMATSTSEAEAFDRFFELLDDHARREPHLVAEIIEPVSYSTVSRNGNGECLPPPKRVRLVQYTRDPGFFALHDSPDLEDCFYPCLSWFGKMAGVQGGKCVIHDAVAFAALRREDSE